MKHKIFILFFLITELFLVINEPYAIRWIIQFPDLLVTALIYMAFLLFMLLGLGKGRSLPTSITVGFLITMSVWFLYYVYYADTSYITRIALLAITYLFLTCLYRKEEDFYLFWKYNNRFILIQTILATLCFILVGVGLLKPLVTVSSPDNPFSEIRFYGGSFSKSLYGNVIRATGFLDEPGALAAWAVFGILFNYAFIKDNLLRKYLPYFTLSTLSVAYIVQMGGFLLLKNIKKIQNIVSVAILVLVLIWGVTLTKGSDFDIYERTIGRFMLDEDTGIVGNSRQDHMENALQIYQKSPFLGVGAANLTEYGELVTDNPYEILAKDGILGYIISYLPLIMILFINRRKEVLICLIIIFAGYQQRPLHINFMHDMYIWSFLLFAIMDAKRNKLGNRNTYKI